MSDNNASLKRTAAVYNKEFLDTDEKKKFKKF